MHASTAFVAAFAALAAAAPAHKNPESKSDTVYENIDIADFTVRKSQAAGSHDKTISAVSFKLSGDDAHEIVCKASDPAFPSKVYTCGESDYRFALTKGTSKEYEFALAIYHQTAPA